MPPTKRLSEIFTRTDTQPSVALKSWEQFLGYCRFYAEQGGIAEKLKINNEQIELSWEPSLWSKNANCINENLSNDAFFTGSIHGNITEKNPDKSGKIDLCDDLLRISRQSPPEKLEILAGCFNNENKENANFHIFQAHGEPGKVLCENFDELTKKLKNRVIWLNSCCEYENEAGFIEGANSFFNQKELPLFCQKFYNNGCSVACSRFRIPLWYLKFQNMILLETLNENSGGFWFKDIFLEVIRKIHQKIFPTNREELFEKENFIRKEKNDSPLIEDFFVHLGWFWYGRQNLTVPMIASPVKEKIEIFSTDKKTPQTGRIFLGTKQEPEWLGCHQTVQQMKLSCIIPEEKNGKTFLLSLPNWNINNFNLTAIEKIISIKNKIKNYPGASLYILLYMIETYWNRSSVIDMWTKELLEQFKKEGITNVFFRKIFPNTKELRHVEKDDRIYIKSGHYNEWWQKQTSQQKEIYNKIYDENSLLQIFLVEECDLSLVQTGELPLDLIEQIKR